MKFAIVFAAILAVACAGLQKPMDSSMAELDAIMAAIQSPSTDPATAALLEQQLAHMLAPFLPQPEPIFVEEPAPISIGPAIIDFPLPDGGAVTAEETAVAESPAIVPAPVVGAIPAAVAEAAAPLVQIILNINKANSVAGSPVSPAPVETPVIDSHPVNVVEEAVNVDSVVPSAPVQVIDTVPTPVQVIEVEPIQIGTPIIPVPVVTLPDILN